MSIFRRPLPARMLYRTVRMTFAPTEIDAFLALFRDARPKIEAVSGCRHVELWRDEKYPNIMTTFSHWDDVEALDAYRRSDLFMTTWARTTPLFAAPPVARSHFAVEV